MIIKGQSRAGPGALAAHLGNAEKNERVSLLETRGTIARDLRGALVEMDAYAAGTRCEKSLYHAAMSPEPPHRLTPEQRAEAIDALEEKLGLTGHVRVVVMHEKLGREHIHVVWSRIDLENMRSVSDSHNYRKHEEVARDLERRFGHERVQGAHAERDGVERPDRTPSRAELRQEERTGIKGKEVKADVMAAFRASDDAKAFHAALDSAGYVLAKGDRRDFVIVDRAGGIHSLARRIDGMKATELREFMAPIDRESLPTTEQAKGMQEDREHGVLPARDQEKWEDTLAANAVEKSIRDEKAAKREDDKAVLQIGEEFVERDNAFQDEKERRQEAREYRDSEQAKADRQEAFNDAASALLTAETTVAETVSSLDRAADSLASGAAVALGGMAKAAEIIGSALEGLIAPPTAAEQRQKQREGRVADKVQQARMDRLLDSDDEYERRKRHRREDGEDWDPDRQREVPGGGRTRNR
jgi:hypothetical protein